jgi:hypothetical protein
MVYARFNGEKFKCRSAQLYTKFFLHTPIVFSIIWKESERCCSDTLRVAFYVFQKISYFNGFRENVMELLLI